MPEPDHPADAPADAPPTRRPLRVDGHLDLASTSLGYDRDLTLDLDALRERERRVFGDDDAVRRSPGTAAVTLPAIRDAGVRLCMASVIARVKTRPDHTGLPERHDLDYHTPVGAEAYAVSQMQWYRRMHRLGELRLIEHAGDLPALDAHEQDHAIATVLMLEGCDPIVEPDDAAWWFDQGVRVACLAHYGRGRYAMGTGGDGPLTDIGKRLVGRLHLAGIALDITHTADRAVEQALDIHEGAVCATHANCRALCDNDRQLTDGQIRAVADRHGVVGVVAFNPMIVNCPIGQRPPRDAVTLDQLADHVDHVCQVTGSADHVGVGSDLDGGFGVEAIPRGTDSITDLARLGDTLADRGYADGDVARVMGGNWRRWLAHALPAG